MTPQENLERVRAELERRETRSRFPKAKGGGFGRSPRNPLPKVNKARKAVRHAACFGKQARFCRLRRCDACGRVPTPTRPSDPHHTLTRGAGGKDDSCVSLCRRCHDLLGAIGALTFQKRFNIDFDVLVTYVRDELAKHDCLMFPESFGLGIRCHVCWAGINAEDVQP
jgi:hypothetical protein